MNTKRKAFNYKNQPVLACGCLFYKYTNEGLQLLLISYKNIKWPDLDDFGGRVDLDDNDIESTIKRELFEESNGLIENDVVTSIFEGQKYKEFYTSKSKYYIIAVQVTDAFFPETNVFGTKEITDDIERTVKWYKYKEIKHKLAVRMRLNNLLMEWLDEISELI